MFLTTIVQKGKKKRHHKTDLTIMKCTPFPPDASSPINLCSSPVPLGPSPAVSCLRASPQHSRAQALSLRAPQGCGRGFGSSSPGFHQCSGEQLPGIRGRATPGPQRILEGLVSAGTMGGGGLASRKHLWHPLMEDRGRRKPSLGFLLLPQNI